MEDVVDGLRPIGEFVGQVGETATEKAWRLMEKLKEGMEKCRKRMRKGKEAMKKGIQEIRKGKKGKKTNGSTTNTMTIAAAPVDAVKRRGDNSAPLHNGAVDENDEAARGNGERGWGFSQLRDGLRAPSGERDIEKNLNDTSAEGLGMDTLERVMLEKI